MADNLEAQWEAIAENLKRRILLTANQKAIVTGAGAEVYKKTLHDETPYNPHHKNGVPHLRDTIHYTVGRQYDGHKSLTGSTDVGFERGEKTTVAYIVNNGSRKMSPKEISNMHFMERAIDKSKAGVYEAEKEVLKRFVKGGHADESGSKSAKGN